MSVKALFIPIVVVSLLGCSVSSENHKSEPIPFTTVEHPGEVVLNEYLSDTDVTFRVEDLQGQPLSGNVVLMVSDGSIYDVLTYDPSGYHLPALYFGELGSQTTQQASILSFISPRSAHAFEPFMVIMTVMDSDVMSVFPLSSLGHFGLSALLSPVASVCVSKDEFVDDEEVLSALADSRTGLIVTPDNLLVWAFGYGNALDILHALVDEIYDGLLPGDRYNLGIETTPDGSFKAFRLSGNGCY